MPPAAGKKSPALLLVCGEDDFAVKQRTRAIYLQWSEELGGMDHEIIDASVSNSGEALKALRKYRGRMPKGFKFDREEAHERGSRLNEERPAKKRTA